MRKKKRCETKRRSPKPRVAAAAAAHSCDTFITGHSLDEGGASEEGGERRKRGKGEKLEITVEKKGITRRSATQKKQNDETSSMKEEGVWGEYGWELTSWVRSACSRTWR